MTDAPRQARGSWWLEEALALPEFAGPDAPSLRADTTADVVIVGGGYTGMWSAWFLKEREPNLDIVLLEQDICGGGPSGRNGGFLNGLYEDGEALVERFGDEGLRTVELAGRSIDEIGSWCSAQGIDAWYGANGDLAISTSPAYDDEAIGYAESFEQLGLPGLARTLSPDQVRARFDSPIARGGVAFAHAANVQPARLARGLRRALIERGVRIHEQTPVTRFGVRSATAETPGGTVRAGRAILGLNAWFNAFGDLGRVVTARGSYIVLTAPAPERLEAIGWTGGEGVYDLRISLHYLRTTPDGRIAFGGGKHRVAPKVIDGRYRYDRRSIGELVREFRHWFPSFDGVPLEAAWGGPIDVSPTHHPVFGTLPGGVSHFGFGFTGGGVGPCHLGGKILSGLALGVADEFTSLPIAGGIIKRFPPRPLLTLGERVISGANVRRDDRRDENRRVGPITNALAHVPRWLGYNLGA